MAESHGVGEATVIEIVNVVAHEGTDDRLSTSYQAAMDVIARHPGARRAWALRQVEDPRVFTVAIEWDSLEAHEDFRNSDLLQDFRACVNGAVETVQVYGHYAVCAFAE